MQRELYLYAQESSKNPMIFAVQGDTARNLVCHFPDIDVATEVTSARIYIEKPDGHKVYNNCTKNNDGTITAPLTSQSLAAIGKAKAQIKLTGSSGYITTYEFIINVLKTIIDSSAIESTDEWGALEYLLDKAGAYVVQSLSDMTDTTKTYYVADTGFCYVYDGTEWVVIGVPEEAIEEAIQEIVPEMLTDYAKIDGYYESLTAGNSLQLLSDISVTDKVPYLFRTAGGSLNIGNRETDKIVGGTLAFNQLQPNTTSRTSNGITYTFNNGELSVSGKATATSYWLPSGANALDFIQGNKYYINLNCNGEYLASRSSETGLWYISGVNHNIPTNEYIYTSTEEGIARHYLQFGINSGYTAREGLKYKPIIINLTKTFGSTIADYIYTLEQSNAGDGVAFFKRLFPKDYYPYNAGTLMSVKTSAHKTVGFNAYNNGSAKVVGGHEYQITGTYSTLSLDGTTITPDASGIFTPSKSGMLTVTGGGDDTCVHLVWDGERDGEYEPYVEHTYALDDVELRGIPKLDASNNLYYDGDTYESDGTVTRNWAEITLNGTETWTISGTASEGFYTPLHTMARATNYIGKILCNSLDTYAGHQNTAYKESSSGITGYAKTDYAGQNWLYAKGGNATTAAEFKTWLSNNPITVVFALATPTTETADPYTNPQIVDDWGTEEYIDERTIPIPVGHETQYPANLKAKLETLPDSPNGNGLYGLKQTSGVNSWELLTKELPSAPLTDGNYILKCTVSGGTPTLTWEEQT